MNNSERLKNEIATILLLTLTLAFTSSNLTSESLKDKTLAERIPLIEAIQQFSWGEK